LWGSHRITIAKPTSAIRHLAHRVFPLMFSAVYST
jgi:hypothetical protein